MGKAICEVVVAPNLLQPTSFYVMKCSKKEGNNMQLLLKVPALLSNDEKKCLEILVDTGAEANLVRIGLLPDHLFFYRKQNSEVTNRKWTTLSGWHQNY